MKISIDHFSNLKKLDFEIQTSKFNFIYGISGSGKSSIATALIANNNLEDLEKHRTYGCTDDVIVSVDLKDEFYLFDDESVHEYVFAKSGKGVYDVFYGENDKLKKLKENLEKFLNGPEIIDIRNIINKHRELVRNIEMHLKLSTTASGMPSKKGLYKTLSNPMHYTNSDVDIDVKQKSWMKQGYGYISDNKCPFCSQEMSDNILKKIMEIVNELPGDYQTVIEASEYFNQLEININIEKINEEEEQRKLKSQIDRTYKILKEMNVIDDILNISVSNDKSLDKRFNVKLSEEVINYFNNVDVDILSFISKLEEGTRSYISLKKRYNSTLKSKIKGNISKINEYIGHFDIEYKFVKNDLLSRDVGYQLIHIDAESDSSHSLSTGEKNIISLILFLISHKEKNVVIDDPVSSYDEYRRDEILKFIINYRYFDAVEKKTTLILSHDQIFLKFLTRLIKTEKYKSSVGNIYHLENVLGECSVHTISSCDVDTLLNHLIHRCYDVYDYSQKILNLRLFYEFQNQSIEYKYLSAILHSRRDGLSTEELNEQLTQKGSNEQEVLKKIYENTGVSLELYTDNKFKLNIENCSKFELICYLREFVSGEDKTELNNIIHFNYALFHILNPYKFNFQSEKSYEILERNIEKIK